MTITLTLNAATGAVASGGVTPNFSALSLGGIALTPPTATGAVATEAFVAAALDALVAGAGAAYDTLAEIKAFILADESTASALAITVAGKAPATRAITAAGLAAGGGDLSADRTITVPAASQAEAEAGTATDKAMTPQRVAQAIAALSSPGVTETYVNDAAARLAITPTHTVHAFQRNTCQLFVSVPAGTAGTEGGWKLLGYYPQVPVSYGSGMSVTNNGASPDLLTAVLGTWSSNSATNGTSVATITGTTYQWQKSTTGIGGTYTDIGGATASTYTVPASTSGHYRVKVVRTNALGSGAVTYSAGVAGTGGTGVAPEWTSPPGLECDGAGLYAVGDTLSISGGTVTGTPTISYTYSWRESADDFASDDGTQIATSAAVVIPTSGMYYRCDVTASNAYGSDTESSGASGIAGIKPSFTTDPVYDGDIASAAVAVGGTASVTDGVATGEGTLIPSWLWKESEDGATDLSVVGTSQDYIVGETDRKLFGEARVSNAWGMAGVTLEIVTVTAPPYVSSGAVTISYDGIVLSVDSIPTWARSPDTVTYQWVQDGTWVGSPSASPDAYAGPGSGIWVCMATATNAHGSTDTYSNTVTI